MMTTAQEIFKATLKELNRADTISMTPDRFNYHAEVGLYEYIKMGYWLFSKHQKSIDDLQPLIVMTDGVGTNPSPIANSGLAQAGKETFTVPKDTLNLNEELFMLQVEFQLRYSGNPCQTDGSLGDPVVARYRPHNLDSRNHYQKGNDDKLYYIYHSGRLRRVVQGSSASVAEKCVMTYLRYPRLITVDAAGASVTNSELGSSQNSELVRWIAASYLETIESIRQETIGRVLGSTFTHRAAVP